MWGNSKRIKTKLTNFPSILFSLFCGKNFLCRMLNKMQIHTPMHTENEFSILL